MRMTDDAFVREFQRRARLQPDGVAGPVTLAALLAAFPGMGATLSPAITAAITAIAGLVAAYFVRNREV